MQQSWASLVDASTSAIHLMARDLSLPDPIQTYARVLSAFLQGDSEKLEQIAKDIQDPTLKEIARLRLSIRHQKFKSSELMRIQDLNMPHILEAEKWFCLGMAWGYMNDDQKSADSFAKANVVYKNNNCPRKALRSLFNCITAESRVQPHKNFMSEYQAVIDQSRAVGDESFEGVALAMLSREYQIVGLLDQALEMVELSIKKLQSERGTIHYFHSLLHKAHILIDLKRSNEIAPLLQESELASFPAIKAACALLQLQLDPSLVWNPTLEKDLMPTWKNRIPQLCGERPSVTRSTSEATDLEQTLLRMAYNGPVEKWDLIERLYPGESSSQALENRFKNLVARIRKKYPDTLLCQGSRYSVAKMPVSYGLEQK